MDDRETYTNLKFTKTDSRSPSRAEPDVSYAELNFKTLSAVRARRDGDGLNSTYSELNFRKEEPRITEDEDPPISSGPGWLLTTGQTGEQKQEPKQNTGNRFCRKISLHCLVTIVLVAIVAGLSIHVSQICQTKTTCNRNYHELNSTLQSKISALNSNLSDVKRMHSDLRHQFTEMETKYRSVNETKAQICELLTCRREQECSQGWTRNEGGCYFISAVNFPYDEARRNCLNYDSKLLEINSPEEENFVFKAVHGQGSLYWIGKCECGKVASKVLYRMYGGDSECGECTFHSENKPCDQVRTRFICEKSTPLCPDIPEKIQDLCQQPVGPT